MGFSLLGFFNDLQLILADPNISDEDSLAMLTKLVKEERKYAAECGQITEPKPH